MIHQIRTFTHVAWVIIPCFTLPAIAQQASFQIIPTPGSFGTDVQALAVAADGKVVNGEYFLFDQDPRTCAVFGGCTRTFRWTAATGPQNIGVIEDKTQALGNSICADGLQIKLTTLKTCVHLHVFDPHQDFGTPVFPNDGSHRESEGIRISGQRSTDSPDELSPTPSSLIPLAFHFRSTTLMA